jgi:hypothetical protein
MSSSRDSKDDVMRAVLIEGQSHHLHGAAGINDITAIRDALSSYQANQNKPNKKPQPEHTAAGNIHAAHDDKDNAKAEGNFDLALTTVILTIPTWWVKWDNIPGIDELPNVLQYLCLAYADYLPVENVIYQYPNSTTISQAPFFTRYISQIQYRLEQAANDLLHDGNIDKGLALIEQNPHVIHIETQGRDRFGRHIQAKTLLQMAAMNGHFNNRDKKAEEKKDHGAVELFSQAAGLTKDEAATQLFPVLFSDEAINENKARKNRVLAVVKEFGESILKRKADLPKSWNTIEEFKAAQAKCKPEFDKLRNDLIRIVSNEVIKLGFILDTDITVEFDKWFTENLTRFGGEVSLISDLIWTGGYGSLQYVSAAPDAHIHRHGIGPVVDSGEIPARTLKNSDGSSHFSSTSKLGLDFYLGYYGAAEPRRRAVVRPAVLAGKLMSSKNICVAKFMQRPSSQSKAGCLIM